MTARDLLERNARRIPGGLAWERDLFRRALSPSGAELIDTAVDIAWECLLPPSGSDHPGLDIAERGALLVIRLADTREEIELAMAA